MNWKKVQNILIFSLILLNVVLWILYHTSSESFSISSTKQSEVMKILEKNNIVVYDYFPDYKPMQRLKIKSNVIDEGKMIENLLGTTETLLPSVTANGRRYEKNGKRIEVINTGEENGIIKYYNDLNTQAEEVISEAKAISLAEGFAESLSLGNVKWKLSFINRLEDLTYMIQFNEYYKDYPIFSSYVQVYINNNGIQYAEYKRLQPDKFVDEKRHIFSIDEVIYKWMGAFRRENNYELIRITNIDLGFDTKLNIDEEEQRQYIEPYYRIRLGNGEEYYINAYTNELFR